MISRTRVFSFQFKSIFFNASLCTTGNIKYWSLGNTQGKREIIVWSDNLKPLVSSIQVKLLKNRIKLLMYWRYYCSLYRTRQNHDNLIFTRILLYNNINDSLKAERGSNSSWNGVIGSDISHSQRFYNRKMRFMW